MMIAAFRLFISTWLHFLLEYLNYPIQRDLIYQASLY